MADPNRFLSLCKAIARREQLLVQAARQGQSDKPGQERLLQEAHHFEAQIARMRQDPSYEVFMDPLEVSAKNGHHACQVQESALRNENLKLRAQVEDLYAKNALYKADIRRLSKHRNRLELAPRGPTVGAARMVQLKAELESYVGFEFSSPNPHQVYLHRPGMEKIVSLLRQAARGGALAPILPLPLQPALVPLSSIVSGY